MLSFHLKNKNKPATNVLELKMNILNANLNFNQLFLSYKYQLAENFYLLKYISKHKYKCRGRVPNTSSSNDYFKQDRRHKITQGTISANKNHATLMTWG